MGFLSVLVKGAHVEVGIVLEFWWVPDVVIYVVSDQVWHPVGLFRQFFLVVFHYLVEHLFELFLQRRKVLSRLLWEQFLCDQLHGVFLYGSL